MKANSPARVSNIAHAFPNKKLPQYLILEAILEYIVHLRSGFQSENAPKVVEVANVACQVTISTRQGVAQTISRSGSVGDRETQTGGVTIRDNVAQTEALRVRKCVGCQTEMIHVDSPSKNSKFNIHSLISEPNKLKESLEKDLSQG